jgi:DNA-binding PadR family transcriptional regulator
MSVVEWSERLMGRSGPATDQGGTMSVRQALLALLEEVPKYGYQLRVEFEERTGATWPLNVGQVYTTLGRLERDGLIVGAGTDGEGHAIYQITDDGRDEVARWFASPVARTRPPRDELAIKLALAVTVPGVDVGTVIQRQRSATMSALQDYIRLKQQADGDPGSEAGRTDDDAGASELAWGLVLDSLIFAAEAEIRWLDHSESKLRKAAALGRITGGGASNSEASNSEASNSEAGGNTRAGTSDRGARRPPLSIAGTETREEIR